MVVAVISVRIKNVNMQITSCLNYYWKNIDMIVDTTDSNIFRNTV